MNLPARLPVDCSRCENSGVIALDDDATLPCPLCNNWCTLCLADVPTFVPITRPYRQNRRGHAASGTIAAFGAGLECAGVMLADSLDEQGPSNR